MVGGTRYFVVGRPWLRRALGHPVLVPSHHEGITPVPATPVRLGFGLNRHRVLVVRQGESLLTRAGSLLTFLRQKLESVPFWLQTANIVGI